MVQTKEQINKILQMIIPAQFDAKTIEDKWYAYWMENNYFHSEPDHRTPYTIVIPPPM
jgi:valyl-tRNA synthetase